MGRGPRARGDPAGRRGRGRGYRRQPLWPPPADAPVAPGRPEPSLFAGAPGIAWALDALERRGHAETTLRPAAVALEALAAWRAEPVFFAGYEDLPQRESSLLSGEEGVLLVAWTLTERPELADDLHALVRANIDADEIDELMWGTAGTLLAARALLDGTGEERWRRACDDSAEALLARRDAEGLWTQRRFEDTRSLGPVHGYVGDVHALLSALEGEHAERLRRESNDTLTRFAVREGALCNWPPAAEEGVEHRRTGEIRLQWCHGAGDRHHGGAVPRRGTPPRGCRADLDRRFTPGAKGIRALPRDGGQRLRAPRSVRAHRRRAVAGANPPLRRPCARAGRA